MYYVPLLIEKKITYGMCCIHACLTSRDPSLYTVICLLSPPHPLLVLSCASKYAQDTYNGYVWCPYPASSNPRILGYGISSDTAFLGPPVMIHSLNPSFHTCHFLEATLFYSSVVTMDSKFNSLSRFPLKCFLDSTVLIVSGTT